MSLPVWTGLLLLIVAGLWRGGERPRAVLLVLTDLSAELLSAGAKLFVNRQPPEQLSGTTDLGTIFSAEFPSGHVVRATATVAVCVALLVWPHPHRRLLAALATVVGLVILGAARVASEAHWPSDVLGGYLLGGALATFALGVNVSRPTCVL